MADITASAVTVVRAWNEGGLTGKERIGKLVRIALTGQGGTANKITAAALGFTKLESCSMALDYTNGNKIIPAVINGAGTAILLANGADAAQANHMTPADLAGYTIQMEVYGV